MKKYNSQDKKKRKKYWYKKEAKEIKSLALLGATEERLVWQNFKENPYNIGVKNSMETDYTSIT